MVKTLILRRNGNDIELLDETVAIEDYSFGKNIDFSLLLNYLMKDGFENSFTLNDNEVTGQTDEEKNLVVLLRKILQSYEKRQAEFALFKNGR